ncbi:MAG: MFS transporter, partial [Magnetospirillum sp.]
MNASVNVTALFALLFSVVLMMCGAGALTTVLSVRLDGAGVSAAEIGLLTAAYFTGTILGSLTAGRTVSGVGHIRAFAVFTSLLSAATLGHALMVDPLAWGMLRLAEGYCMAGMLICVESWLNQSAQPANRGKVLALYMVCLYGGYGAGQFLLGLPGTAGAAMFAILSICLSVALVPVALSRQAPPPLPRVGSFS